MNQHVTLALLAFGLGAAHGAPGSQATADPIPLLNTKGDVYKTEGENDPLIYDPAVGTRKMIMLYLDFPDREMSIDTTERGRKVLGGNGFEELFKEQSYGKLSFDIRHVHGWRRLTKPVRQYSSKTTEAHRELFEEIFSLYPKIDFRDYDYAVAHMPGIGNTAFGERDDLAIPYRGAKINVALNVSSISFHVLAHEVAHCMGLPDLYTYGGVEGPRNPAGPWDIMSAAGRSTGFLGWHRHKLRWLDAERKAYLTKSSPSLNLSPLSGSEGTSMLVIPVDDPAHPSKVFVIEVAQPIRLRDGTRTKEEGILVYSVDATLATGQNQVVVYPREDLVEAAYHVGDRFDSADAPFRMTVLKRHADGGYDLDIRIKK
jgi:M6 family metalloprotease-like protein